MEWIQENKPSRQKSLGENLSCDQSPLGFEKGTGETISNKVTDNGEMKLGMLQVEPGWLSWPSLGACGSEESGLWHSTANPVAQTLVRASGPVCLASPRAGIASCYSYVHVFFFLKVCLL